MGGVLFIDEAYYLHRPENERDYGQEAIEILLQLMENDREDLVVILAGYRDRMETFFQSNPGMHSRIAHHIDFPDYTTDELFEIAYLMLDRQQYRLSSAAQEIRENTSCAVASSQTLPTRAVSATRSTAPGCARQSVSASKSSSSGRIFFDRRTRYSRKPRLCGFSMKRMTA